MQSRTHRISHQLLRRRPVVVVVVVERLAVRRLVVQAVVRGVVHAVVRVEAQCHQFLARLRRLRVAELPGARLAGDKVPPAVPLLPEAEPRLL